MWTGFANNGAGPMLIKGLLHPLEAREAQQRGADAIIVSNHLGRQVDGVVASISALPGIVAAISGSIPVLIDGGFRRGADVVKALALGARAVRIGRPHLWGVACAGEDGCFGFSNCFVARSIARWRLAAGMAWQSSTVAFFLNRARSAMAPPACAGRAPSATTRARQPQLTAATRRG